MAKRKRVKAKRWRFTVTQDGMIVASGEGPERDIKPMAAHYGMMYSQDGPVDVRLTPVRATRR